MHKCVAPLQRYYMSPELVEGKPYDAKSDVWATGCLLYELMTRTHPFNGANQAALLMGIMRGKYEPVEKFPGVRVHANCHARALHRHTSERALVHPPPQPPPPPPPPPSAI